jgi:hypothetical protein
VGRRAGRIFAAGPSLLFLAGCGYVGDPLPPLANIPLRIEDVAAVQRGARLIVQFTPPVRTTEGMPVEAPLRLDLRVGVAVNPFTPEAWAGQAKPIPEVEVTNGIARYEVSAAEWTGKEVTIAARAIGPNRKDSGWSNFVNLQVVPAPGKPAGLRADATANGVRLTWTGADGRYRVFRKAGDEKEFSLAEAADRPQWVDQKAETGKTYAYMVQRVVPAGLTSAESELSDVETITVRDTFAPAAPAGIRAVAATQSIELTWERNTEPDLAGYRIYRSTGDGAFEKIADTPALPTFSDRSVETGKAYRYKVTAVDASGNESERSAAVDATI